ncbi:MAG: Gfo/Idh/MocA family oxidoreductase [Verrucomicrobiae bacterium]|nr:Gfo/Idh/MocA family oxidoreductase [Verrucomicrobiae bacterium]
MNDQVRVAIIGMGNRGGSAVRDVFRTEGVNLVAICDPDQERLDKHKAEIAKDRNATVDQEKDFRRILDRDDIDAVIITSPNHWHALHTIMACQAGKDVYVEKPVCHNVWEGQQMLAAEKKYGRIIQSGLQGRSDVGLKEAWPYIREGNLGKILSIHCVVYDHRDSIGKLDTPMRPPKSVDYNLWLGPAVDQPIYRPRLHYDWHWDWNTGNGDTGNQGVHELDLVRSVLGDPGHPKRVFSYGGRFAWNDAGNTPNMQNTVFDWGNGIPVIFELRDLWATPKNEAASHYHGHHFGVVIQCEGGEFRGGRGGGSVYDRNGDRMKAFKGDGGFDHHPAFVRAVKSRKRSDIACTLEQGFLSTCLCHQANISMKLGQTASPGEVERAISDNPWLEESHFRLLNYLKEWSVDFDKDPWTLGQKLEIAGDRKMFTGTVSAQANRLLKRSYGKNFAVPEKV